MNSFSYNLIYVKITNKCILAISKMFVPTLRSSVIWNLGGREMHTPLREIINMPQMSESAVTFQGAELSQWPPVRAENAQHPIEALSLLAHWATSSGVLNAIQKPNQAPLWPYLAHFAASKMAVSFSLV